MDMYGNDTGAPQDAGQQASSATDSTARMRRAIAAAMKGEGTPEELQTAARELVRELKRANEPPEQMLLRIKDMMADAGLRPTYASDSIQPIDEQAALYRDIIMLSIRYYYENA